MATTYCTDTQVLQKKLEEFDFLFSQDVGKELKPKCITEVSKTWDWRKRSQVTFGIDEINT